MNNKCRIAREKRPNNIIRFLMKTIAITAMFLLAVILLIPSTVLADGGFEWGDGSLEQPFEIATAEQLATVAEAVYLDMNFILVDDIDLGVAPYNTGEGWEPIGTYDMGDSTMAFTGSFDGDGHTISGLFINRDEMVGVGLFGYTIDATIQNVTLDNADITGDVYVGSLVGQNENGTISGCSAEDVEVTGFDSVGGLVGSNDSGNIANSFATAEVRGVFAVGGLVGDNFGGSIESSYATGTVLGIDYDDPESQGHFGGLVGRNYCSGTIANSYATGNVTGIHLVGGLAGSNTDDGVIAKSYSTGDAAGTDYVGGLVGLNSLDEISYNNPVITNCYATGSVEGTQFIGGLVGQNHEGDIAHSFSVGVVSGGSDLGGLVGNNDEGAVIDSFYDSSTSDQLDDEGKGEPKSTAEMNTYATFFEASWDFIDEMDIGDEGIWGIDESADDPDNDGYPFLAWQGYDHKVWPAVSTMDAENITDTTADGKGEIIIVGYPYPTQHGVVWSVEENPTLDDNKTTEEGVLAAGPFTSVITGLEPETTYYVRAYATNDLGTVYGGQISFTTDESDFAGGDGSSDNPYRIETAEQLATVAEAVYLNQHFVLADDIDLSLYLSNGGAGWNEGAGWMPIGTEAAPFTGSFDGGEEGYIINDLFVNRPNPGTNRVGMFGCTGDGAEIRNLRLENVDVVGYGYVGSIVGNNEGVIENSYATGDVEGIFFVGGLVGYCETTSSINDCYTMVNVVGEDDDVGGLVGSNNGIINDSFATGVVEGNETTGGLASENSGTIINSYSEGNVTGNTNEGEVGGLVGYNFGTIENSYASGEVCGIANVGGLVGMNGGSKEGNIENSYATGTVEGNEYVGGLVGINGGSKEGNIENSYAKGAVEGNEYVGGLVGANRNSSTVFNSYAVGDVTGDGFYGGLMGENEIDSTITSSCYDTETTCQGQGVGTGDDSGVIDLSTAEMKQQDSFEDWDFSDTWNIAEGTYPYLEWQTDHFDFAPPVFSAGYPKAENITHEGLDILVQVDEGASAYYVVLDAGESAPEAAQVKAGKDSSGATLAENFKGSIEDLSAGIDGTAAITGLAPGTEYVICVVAEDTAGNLQPDDSVAFVEVDTGLLPTGDMDFELTIPNPETVGNNIAVNQTVPKSVNVNTVNGTESVVITGTKTMDQGVAVGGADADIVTAAVEDTEPTYTVNTSAIAAAGGTYEFTLTVSEAEKDDIIYNVTVTVAVPDTIPPVPGSDGTITASNITNNSMNLSWVAATDNVSVQQNLQYKVVCSESDNIDTIINAEANGTTVKNWLAALTVTKVSGLSAKTQYYFNVIVRDEAGNMAVYDTESQTTSDVPEREDRDDRSRSGKSDDSPVYNVLITGSGTSKTTLSINVNTQAGSATVNLGEKFGDGLSGEEVPVITMPSIPGVNNYTLGISTDSLSGTQNKDILTFSTPKGSITLPSSMLEGIDGARGKRAGIAIGEGDKSLLADDVKEALGDRPLVQLSLTLDGKQVGWSNPDAPVTVSIPYKPTAAELSDPEHIVIWYIDGSGNVVSVPNGRYDPATGNVVFTTTHFSHYAVAYVTKSFNDLESVAWAKKSIDVLTSKGILKGLTEKEYDPQTNITRADFLYYLVRTLGVDAKLEGNFSDIGKEAYYYKEIAIAKKLGITSGTGNNKFSPDESITRQDMMVLTQRALRMIKKLDVQGSASELDKFSDKSFVADYAVDGVTSIVKEGLIVGSSGRINPLGSTTRAEAATILYRIYSKY